jgi:NADH-quinone oxidoreductase subunit J
MGFLLAQAAETASTSSTAEVVMFWFFAVVAVGAAIAMISMKNIVHAALMLVLNLLSIAALYLALQSSFLGIVQIIVYAGAIMVLFLFVIMLLGITRDDLLFSTRRGHRIGAAVVGAMFAGLLLFAFSGDYMSGASRCGEQAPAATSTATTAATCVGLDTLLVETNEGSVGIVAEAMFTRYTFPFEIASLLLVVATIGALIIGRRDDPDPGEDLGMAATASTGPTADTDVVLADDVSGPEVV